MLFERGICTSDYPSENVPKSDVIFRTLHAAVTGGMLSVFTSSQRFHITDLTTKNVSKSYETQARFLAPIVAPVANLKSLLPTRFNACGGAANVGDATLGGVFPHADADRVARELGKIRPNCY